MQSWQLCVYVCIVMVLHMSMVQGDDESQLNERPIIGILSQPSEYPEQYNPENYSQIAASYVQWIQSAGARVIPIQYDLEELKLMDIINQVNGLLLPGGANDLWNEDNTSTQFQTAANFLLTYAVELNRKGINFPVFGICGGYQQMMYWLSKDSTRFYDQFQDKNRLTNLIFVKSNSFLLDHMSTSIRKSLTYNNIVFQNHRYGLTPESFQDQTSITKYFDLIAVSADANGKLNVAVVEGKSLPFYGVQFHPEKSIFEWKKKLNIKHTPDAIAYSHYFSQFFVGQARKNQNQFIDKNIEKSYLIYNHNPVQIEDSSFMQIYFFKNIAKVNVRKDSGEGLN